MHQIVNELAGQLFYRLLGWDGIACALLLACGMWCGHYAVRAGRLRSAEAVVLMPMTLASFGGAVLVCESTLKLVVLLGLAMLTSFARARVAGAPRR